MIFLLSGDILCSEVFPTKEYIFVASLSVTSLDANHAFWCFLARWRYLLRQQVDIEGILNIQNRREMVRGKMVSLP